MSAKLKALPVQFIQIQNGVILRRGCTEVKITGEGSAEVVQLILESTINGEVTAQEICDKFAAPDRQAVQKLVERLVDKRILVPSHDKELKIEGPESSLQIFYWHFTAESAVITRQLNSTRFAILGVNCISRQLSTSLISSEAKSIEVIDHPLLRNLRFFDEGGKLRSHEWQDLISLVEYAEWLRRLEHDLPDCIIATSDFGGQQILQNLNRFCIEQERHFLPVLLQGVLGYVGPLVVPGETACFNCLRMRLNAHLIDPESASAVEAAAFEGQPVIGFHPSMASILGDIAGFELIKFYSRAIPSWNIGTLIEVNLLATRLSARRVLKVPRCPVCSPLIRKSSVTLEKSLFTGKP